MWRVSTGAFVNRDVLTVIHAGDSDGNGKTVGDPFFVPFIGAPCFPSYPSNHGSAAGGGVEVLRRLYGEAGHLIPITNPWLAGLAMQYTRFEQISNDISDARVYGGSTSAPTRMLRQS